MDEPRQIIAFTQALLKHTPLRKILVLVPINCLENWGSEYYHWLRPENRVPVYNILLERTYRRRTEMLTRWEDKGTHA